MRIQTMRQLAVCSWSGWPKTPEVLLQRLEGIGLRRIQLALDPLVDNPAWARVRGQFAEAGITVVSGMFGTALEDYTTPATIQATGGLYPDGAYDMVIKRIPAYVDLLNAFGLDKISFHAGFIPHDDGGGVRAAMLRKLAAVSRAFHDAGKLLLLETGQETADTLSALLAEIAQPNLRVNFDPGNMLLYGMGDPVEALQKLMPHIAQIHIKDAVSPATQGAWGIEKPAGEGGVDWPRFFDILAASDYAGDLVIERECGDDPVGEICRAVSYLAGILK